MFGNYKGNATVEAAIIVPVILVIICFFIMLLLKMFQFSYAISEGHEQIIKNCESELSPIEFKIFDRIITLKYQLPHTQTTVQKLVATVEYLFYLLEHYYDRLKVGL